MGTPGKIPQLFTAIFAILIMAVSLSCNGLSGKVTPAAPADQSSLTPTGVQPDLPEGWKLSKDASGACQVATPADWQLGRDFFLEAEKLDPDAFANLPGKFPPTGLALWGMDEGTPWPQGKQYQSRTALVVGERVCSVWRIKADTDFTDAEKSEIEKVGKTLQVVN